MKRILVELVENLRERYCELAAHNIDTLIKKRIVEYALAERRGNDPRSKESLIEQVKGAWNAADREDA